MKRTIEKRNTMPEIASEKPRRNRAARALFAGGLLAVAWAASPAKTSAEGWAVAGASSLLGRARRAAAQAEGPAGAPVGLRLASFATDSRGNSVAPGDRVEDMVRGEFGIVTRVDLNDPKPAIVFYRTDYGAVNMQNADAIVVLAPSAGSPRPSPDRGPGAHDGPSRGWVRLGSIPYYVDVERLPTVYGAIPFPPMLGDSANPEIVANILEIGCRRAIETLRGRGFKVVAYRIHASRGTGNCDVKYLP